MEIKIALGLSLMILALVFSVKSAAAINANFLALKSITSQALIGCATLGIDWVDSRGVFSALQLQSSEKK